MKKYTIGRGPKKPHNTSKKLTSHQRQQSKKKKDTERE